jgi:ATP-binding cassette subfamily F protein 3
VDLDYFAQDQYRELNADARVLDDLSEMAPRTTNTELRNLLGCFLFSEDDVFKRIGVLSGGERNRYALARMLLHPSNFLLLDEPTNHLDMRAKDVLLESLEKFTGTVMFVSHDRYFLENLANRVFEVADGTLHVYPGNYADYLWRKAGGAVQAPTVQDTMIAPRPTAPLTMPAAKRINPIKLKQMQDEVRDLESRIAELEADIQRSELALSDFVGAEEAMRLAAVLDSQQAQLTEAMTRWESISAELEAIA